jgi:NADH:ubiquinone oxidoreductase subunit 6 (subunit J)
MSFGELLVRWALVIGFGLLGAVTALAAVMIVVEKQPGNVMLLSIVAILSSAITFILWRGIKRLE